MKKLKKYLILSALALMVIVHSAIQVEASEPVAPSVNIASISLDSSGYYYNLKLNEYPAELSENHYMAGVEYRIYTKSGKKVCTGYNWYTEFPIFGTTNGQTYYVRVRSFLDYSPDDFDGVRRVYSDWSAKKYFTSKEKTGASTYTVTTVTDSKVKAIHDKLYAHKEGFTLKVKGNLSTSRKTLKKLQKELAKKNTYHVMFAIDGWRDMSDAYGKVKNGYTYYTVKLDDTREYYWAIRFGKKAFEDERKLKSEYANSSVKFNGKTYTGLSCSEWVYMDMASIYELDCNYIMKLDKKALATLREGDNRVLTKKFYQLSPTERFEIIKDERFKHGITGEHSSGEVRYDWTTLRYLVGESEKYGYGVCRHEVKTTFYLAEVFGISTEHYYLPINNHAYGVMWLKDSSGANKWTIVEGSSNLEGITIGCVYNYSDSNLRNSKLNKKNPDWVRVNDVVNAMKKKYPSVYKKLKVSNIFYNWRDGYHFIEMTKDNPDSDYFGQAAKVNAPKLIKYNVW